MDSESASTSSSTDSDSGNRQVPPLEFDFNEGSKNGDPGAVDGTHGDSDARVSQASTDTQRASVTQHTVGDSPRVADGAPDSRPDESIHMKLELMECHREPPPPLMTGTPRTPRGSIPYERELLREKLDEQLAMTAKLRAQLDSSSAEAAVKQLRENWLLAEDRADQHRARLTDVCLQQVPGLKRELAALSSENSVLKSQVAELMDELQEATSLGHELVLASPRQQDINSMEVRIEEQLRATEQLQGQTTQQLQHKDEELQMLRVELAKGDEEREELRARVTQVCAQHLPELKQQLAERDRAIDALEAENEELRTRATQLVTVYIPDLKNEISSHEQENTQLHQQVAELQAEANQKSILQAQIDSISSNTSGMQEEIMELKSRLAEASMQAADLRAELKQRDIAQSQHVVEIELLRRQLDSVDDESVRQAEEWEEKTSGLTKNHVHAMDTHNKQVAQDVATLTEQWQNDVASRDLRIQEMESTASDMQTMLTEANVQSARLEASMQERAAEFEVQLAELKAAHRTKEAKLETSLGQSVQARQHLEARVASGEADAALLRSTLQETRRQLEVASREKVQQESTFEVRKQELDALSESDSRRCAALQRQVDALQRELLELSESAANSHEGAGSAAIRTSQQLSWYSQQLDKSQQASRRLQSEVDRLSRENFQLNEQSCFAREQLAKSTRNTLRSSDDSPVRTSSGGGERLGSPKLTTLSEQLSDTMADLQHSRELASVRASELERLQMQKGLTPGEVMARRQANEVTESRASHVELRREHQESLQRDRPSDTHDDTVSISSPRGTASEVALLSKQRSASAIQASQLRAELSSFRAQVSKPARPGLGALPTGVPARPRSEEVRSDGLGKSTVERQAMQDSTAKQPGEKWSDYYARRAVAA